MAPAAEWIHRTSTIGILVLIVTSPILAVHAISSIGPESYRFVFAASGDLAMSKYSSESLYMLNSLKPSFFLAMGDLSYAGPHGEAAYCRYVNNRVGQVPVEILSGNHEDGTEMHNGLIDNFARCLPDRLGVTGIYGKEYYFDYPARTPLARFILISPNLTFTNGGPYSYAYGTVHYNWVSSIIDNARTLGIPWVIVGMHKNCLSMGEKPCEVGADLINLLVSKKVDLIIQAHEHNYQRSKQLTCIGTPTFKKKTIYNPSCISNDGSTGDYLRGEGSVILIAGTFGVDDHAPINLDDPEAPFFAAGIGAVSLHGKPVGDAYNGTVWKSYLSILERGFEEYTISATGITGEFIPSGNQTKAFHDTFTIQAGSQSPASTAGGLNPKMPSFIGLSPLLQILLIIGVLGVSALYPAYARFGRRSRGVSRTSTKKNPMRVH